MPLLQQARTTPVRLCWQAPFDWRSMLAYLKLRAIPGVECVTDTSYSRTIQVAGEAGHLSVVFSDDGESLLLTNSYAQPQAQGEVADGVRKMFDLDAESILIEAALSRDPHLRKVIASNSGIRVPVAWDGFEVAVRAIVGQQVSVKGATTVVARLAKACGSEYSGNNAGNLHLLFPAPGVVVQSDLSGLGITTRRIEAIRNVALAVATGELCFDGSMDSATFVERAVRIPGIGPWTAQYIALRALDDADAFPNADLILLRAAAPDGIALTPKQLLARAEQWRPWRAYAVMLLWKHYAQQTALNGAKEALP